MGQKRGRGNKKQAKAYAPEVSAKRPKAASAPSSQGEKPVFCLTHADRASSETYGFDLSPEHAVQLLEFLCEMSKLTWREIEAMQTGGRRRRHRKHHSQPIDTLAKEAQEHIAKRRLDETFGDEIFRFRLTGEIRLWGFRDGATFNAVWWDPEHDVCPTDND